MRRRAAVIPFLLLGCACAALPAGPEGIRYRDSCMHMEKLAFEGEYAARRVEGSTVNGDPDDFESLRDVQVAARSLSTKRIAFAVSDSTGRFTLPRLDAGLYEVWTCLDGFDSAEFRVRVSPTSPQGEFVLLLRPSESGAGTAGVRFVESR